MFKVLALVIIIINSRSGSTSRRVIIVLISRIRPLSEAALGVRGCRWNEEKEGGSVFSFFAYNPQLPHEEAKEIDFCCPTRELHSIYRNASTITF